MILDIVDNCARDGLVICITKNIVYQGSDVTFNILFCRHDKNMRFGT